MESSIIAGPKDGSPTKAIAARNATDPLEVVFINRRNLDEHDVKIEIAYCGICHSDVHKAKNEWGGTAYPLIPGHEITGFVIDKGKKVTRFDIQDKVAVGVFVDSCRTCNYCKIGLNQYCDGGRIQTFGSVYSKDGGAQTCGGYSTCIVADENYVFKLPDSLPMDKSAPLLCAGVTVYSPLRHFNVNANSKVGVAGFGGLGHLAVKLANALKAEVTVFSRTKEKEHVAKTLGAKHFILSTNKAEMQEVKDKFDVIIDTISASHNIIELIDLLTVDGTLVIVGLPPDDATIQFRQLIIKRRSITGSNIGSTKEVEELLEFCAIHGIVSDIQLIPVSKINEAYDRLSKGDICYRYVIDMKSLK